MSCIENKKSSNEKKIKADTDVCIEGRQFKKKKRDCGKKKAEK